MTRKLDVVEPPELAGLPPVEGTITATVRLIASPRLPNPARDREAGTNTPGAATLPESFKARTSGRRLAMVSATVYDHSRTLLRWWPDGAGKKERQAWSNLDFNHISGLGSCQVNGSDGVPRTYSLLLALGNEDTSRMTRHGEKYQARDLPDLTTSGPAFAIVGDEKEDPQAIALIESLHRLYREEGARMAADRAAHDAARKSRFAYLLAHPPVPENVTIDFWKREESPLAPNQLIAGRDPRGPDPQPQLQPGITKGAADTWEIGWEGVEGRTYFLQWSLDLGTWTSAPFLTHGTGAKRYGARSTSSKFFVRLAYSDQPTTDPEGDDFDGDKVSNLNEVRKGTHPLENSDDDLDGIPSDWEIRFLLDPNDPLDASGDRDGDTISNEDEFAAGTDPTDFYNGHPPSISTISGELGYAEPGGFSILVKEVKRNGLPLADAPVRFETTSFSAPVEFSLTGDGSGLSPRLSARTGQDGRVTLHVKRGPTTAAVYVNTYAGSEVGVRASSNNNLRTEIRRIFPVGTMGRSVTDAVDDRLEGKDPAISRPLFSTQDHIAATYVRNTACWIHDLSPAMTCISPWNSFGGAQRAGVAITPRHILNAAHFELFVGNTIRFITTDNSVVTRTIVSKAIHPLYSGSTLYPDVAIYTLDSDLPSTITPCKLLPSSFEETLRLSPTWKVPAVALDQEEKALAADLTRIGVTQRPGGPDEFRAVFAAPTLPQKRADFHESRIEGDSGNPVFLIVNGELALVSVWTFSAQGTSLAAILPDLNAMIQAADAQAGTNTGFQVQTTDLSGFLPFSPP